MNICIFEDFSISGLSPVNHLRHTSEIICGAATLKDKIEFYFKPKLLSIYSRNYLARYLKEKFPAQKINSISTRDVLFVNARALLNRVLAEKISKRSKPAIWTKDGSIIAILANGKIFEKINSLFTSKPVHLNNFNSFDIEKIELKDEVKILNYTSDIINYFDAELRSDLREIYKVKKKPYVSPKCNISKFTELDSSSGEIFIGKNTIIEPYCYIKGPIYIGNNCTIRSGTAIYGPVRIGDNCKVSGEITSSILHSYVNKQHLGFLGHSYLCEWVNLGAGTTTSNLKNNYSEIVITIGGKKIKTNSIFLGSIIGDHTKTGIQTMLNTGSLIGISSNIFGSGYHDKTLRSFSWADAGGKESLNYEFDRALNTAKVSMKRRDVKMTGAYEEIFKYVYDNRDKMTV
jgi:UDP-N-acetylglucosamine diphosphorylase/glucosamine-1-phosphate N-acetyltransferase